MSYHGRHGRGWAFTRGVLERLTAEAEAGAAADMPEMLASLEKVKARVWQRMTAPTTAPEGPARVLTVKQAAERLGTSVASLRRKRKRLRLGYLDPLDGRLKFTEAELAAYTDSSTRRVRWGPNTP